MEKNSNRISYGFFKKGNAWRAVFAVFLIVSLFTPTSLMVSPTLSIVDSVKNTQAQEYDFDFDYGSYDGYDYSYDDTYVPFDYSFSDYSDTAAFYDSIEFDFYSGGETQSDSSYDSIVFEEPNFDFWTNQSTPEIDFEAASYQWQDNQDWGGGYDNSGYFKTQYNSGDYEAEEIPYGAGDYQDGSSAADIPYGAGDYQDPTIAADIPYGAGDYIESVAATPWWLLGGLGVLAGVALFSEQDELVPPVLVTSPPVIPSCTVPTITSVASASGNVGSVFSHTFSATGNTPVTFGASGLPAGLSFSGNTISGTPTTSGTFSVTATATNVCGSATQTLTITVNPAGVCPAASLPVITSVSPASGVVGISFIHTLTAMGNTPITFAVTGLPAGLTLNGNIISGTPTAAGTSTVTVTATNNCGQTTQVLTIVIAATPAGCSLPAPIITGATTTSAIVNQPFSYQITASNSPNSFNATGLPAGISVSTSTGLISGTPTNAGTVTGTISASNNCGTGTSSFTINVSAAPSGGGGGGGGGGGSGGGGGGGGGVFAPSVTLLSATPSPLAAANVYLAQTPYGGLYLSEVPYTGLGDIALTLAYLLALLILSAALSYLSIYGKAAKPFLNAFNEAYLYVKHWMFNIKDPALAVVSEIAVSNRDETTAEKLIVLARENGAFLGERGVEVIVRAAEADLGRAVNILCRVVEMEKESTPSDRFVILSEEKIKENLFAAYLSLAPVFARWIEEGKRREANALLRKIEKQGFDAKEFLAKAQSEFTFVSNFAYAKV